MDMAAIGKRLRELRGIRTRVGVAKEAGIQATALANYEAGRRMPSDKAKLALSRYYGLTVDELFFADNNHNE